MNAFLKLLLLALLIVVAMYIVDMIMPAQTTVIKYVIAALIAGAIDIFVFDRNVETSGYKLRFS